MLSEKVFSPSGNGEAGVRDGKFNHEPLEKLMVELVAKHDASGAGARNELLKDDRSDSPKVFVCAAQARNADAVVIRSYTSSEWDDLYDICKIWEAARATSAASKLFEPVKIGNQRYVDGEWRHNNPIEKVDQETQGKKGSPCIVLKAC